MKINSLKNMMTLFQKVNLYSPHFEGQKDVLVAGKSIIAVADHIEVPKGLEVNVLDCSGKTMIPGLVDAHVHITGAGAEAGPASRMPELEVSMMIDGGVTTVVGCLGTDGITRSVDSVLMKVKSLRAKGMSAWMYTGAYQVPPPSITGDIMRDIALIEEVVGLGEIAVSDHRSSVPSTAELAKLAAHTRVAGMIGGKAGIVNLHMGDAIDPFRPIHQVVESSELHYKQFVPTHCNRNSYIFEDAKEYGKTGYVDITTSSYPYYMDEEIKPSIALKQLLDSGVPIQHITFTSDSCGSLPGFDPVTGKLIKIKMGLPSSILRELKEAVVNEKVPFEIALQVATSNPADILQLAGKGYVKVGYDADLVLLDSDFNILRVMANGRLVL